MKTLVSALAVAVVGVTLSACGATTTPAAPAPVKVAPVKAPTKVVTKSYTETIMELAWAQQDKSAQQSACAGWRVAPGVVLGAFEDGAGAEAMASIDEDEVVDFFNSTCGTGA